MSETAQLIIGDQKIELPIIVGSKGERAVDISRLRADGKVITLDPGYVNTGSCESAIAFIDGEKGILEYRGYPIEELAGKTSFLEVANLLIYGELPTEEKLNEFEHSIINHTMVHESMRRFYGTFPATAHPMAVCAAAVAALSSFYSDSLDPEDPRQVEISIHRLIAKFPAVIAYAYKQRIGQPFMYPRNDLDYVGNFLRLMFATPTEDYEVDPVVRDALEMLLIVHADHEQNCSTSTMRVVGSANTNLFASVSAAISALWGPRHGGANQKVIEMLVSIRDEGISAKEFVQRAKDKNNSDRLMGFGHRVYKNRDPRATIIREHARGVLKRKGAGSQLLDIAVELEEIALSDDYFAERKLFPNVDFYSGVVYNALGIPTNLFTAIFALGRLPGWLAQWREMHEQNQRIARPRQIYTGATTRDFVPMKDRV